MKMEMEIGIDIGGTKIMAGGILQVKEVVKNVVDWRIATSEESLYMARTAYSKSIGIDGAYDKITNGYDTGFIALTPDLELTGTICWLQYENLLGKEGER